MFCFRMTSLSWQLLQPAPARGFLAPKCKKCNNCEESSWWYWDGLSCKVRSSTSYHPPLVWCLQSCVWRTNCPEIVTGWGGSPSARMWLQLKRQTTALTIKLQNFTKLSRFSRSQSGCQNVSWVPPQTFYYPIQRGGGEGTLYMILLAMQNKIMKGTVQIAVLILPSSHFTLPLLSCWHGAGLIDPKSLSLSLLTSLHSLLLDQGLGSHEWWLPGQSLCNVL